MKINFGGKRISKNFMVTMDMTEIKTISLGKFKPPKIPHKIPGFSSYNKQLLPQNLQIHSFLSETIPVLSISLWIICTFFCRGLIILFIQSLKPKNNQSKIPLDPENIIKPPFVILTGFKEFYND